MTTDSPGQNPGDRKTLLEIKDLLDRADQLEAEERRPNSSTGGSSARETIGYVEFMARRAGISVEEQARRMGLAPQAGRAKARR
jgi:hypothetical protein